MALKIDLSHTGIAGASNGRSRGLILIVWVFVAIVAALFLFANYSIGVMSAARAYVGGEGLWSKAQKEAVYALSRYCTDRDPREYEIFKEALLVSLGDRQARLELEKPDPDLQVAAAGFLQGRNHPDDVDGMIRLFRSFRRVPEIDKAIAIWAQGDVHIDQLIALGDKVHTAMEAGTLDANAARGYLTQLHEINALLTPLEDQFSYTLGEASRKTRTVLLIFMFVAVSGLLTVAYVFSGRVVRQSEDLQHALRESELQLRGLLQFAPLPIIIVRVGDEAIVYANNRALEQFGVTAASLRQYKAKNFYVRPEDREQVVQVLGAQGSVRDWEVELRDAAGRTFWSLISSQRIAFAGEDCLLTALNNIEDRRRAQEELRHRAFHDDLTGLPNRAMFMDALSRTLHRMERKNGVFSILFIDLDQFKEVNDSLGHTVGDVLLQEVAMRIRLCVREGDLVARLGGDEFVILVEGEDNPGEVISIAQKILSALEPEHQLEGHVVRVTSSIGISRYPENGTELNDLLRNADAAMYKAKERGRNNFQVAADSRM
ncbi:MAG TPA: sensor domain-containing diguanylate cyclase [Burkholderiaceae bacterium]|nr:sensor domain-containing diguanylate cyclase [Burkholderiaceae bacterium]